MSKHMKKTLNITHVPHFCKITQIIGNGSVYINRLFHIKEEVPLVGKSNHLRSTYHIINVRLDTQVWCHSDQSSRFLRYHCWCSMVITIHFNPRYTSPKFDSKRLNLRNLRMKHDHTREKVKWEGGWLPHAGLFRCPSGGLSNALRPPKLGSSPTN